MLKHKEKDVRSRVQIEVLERRQLMAGHGFVTQTNLLSDGFLSGVPADASLKNPWGISYFPGGPLWVSDNNAGVSTFYDGTGAKQGEVTIPGGGGASPSNPTGQVFAGGNMFFNGTPEQFVFVGEDGAITAWNSGTTATLVHDNSPGAVYKGLALAQNAAGQDEIFAANFRSGQIEVYDQNFNPTTVPGGFVDKRLPKGYAPFNVQNINGQLFVTYAKQNDQKHDDVSGAGHGFVDVFDTSGHLVRRFNHGSFLDSPWGVTVAPASWGNLAGDILVGQFGSGRIDVFKPKGGFVDFLRDQFGKPVVLDGLWGVVPGSGLPAADPNSIFFTAGSNSEADGLFGTLTFTAGPFKHKTVKTTPSLGAPTNGATGGQTGGTGGTIAGYSSGTGIGMGTGMGMGAMGMGTGMDMGGMPFMY